MQWNACSVRAHFNEFKHYLSSVQSAPDVICINESFLKPCHKFELLNYEVVRKDRIDSMGGGIITLIKSGIAFKVLETPESMECLAVEIKLKNKLFVVVNVYISPSVELCVQDFKQLFRFRNAIITGDFNAHNRLWKSKHTNKRGETIEEIMNEFNYCIINRGEGTHQNITGGMSVLDLSIVSSSIANICEWSVGSEMMGSDHLPTFTSINGVELPDQTMRSKWLIPKANWNLYKEKCCELFKFDQQDNDVINSGNQQITEAILKAASGSIPKTGSKINTKYKPLPFWSAECSKQVRLRNAARNRFNRTKNTSDGLTYRRQKGLTQRTIKQSSKNYWNEYCSSLNNNTKLGSVWRKSKKMRGEGNNSFKIGNLSSNGIIHDTETSKADVLADTFAAVSSDLNYSDKFKKRKDEFELNNVNEFIDSSSIDARQSNLNECFTLTELQQAIKQSKNGTSPGDDTIHYEMIKELPADCIKTLLHFYNDVWMSGEIPRVWNHAIVLPLKNRISQLMTLLHTDRSLLLQYCVK